MKVVWRLFFRVPRRLRWPVDGFLCDRRMRRRGERCPDWREHGRMID